MGRVPLGQMRLSDSIVSLLHYKQQYIIACLANGRCELIPRVNDQVLFTRYLSDEQFNKFSGRFHQLKQLILVHRIMLLAVQYW